MNRNKNIKKGRTTTECSKRNQRPSSSGSNRTHNNSKRNRDASKYDGDDAKLSAEGRNNNPNWYFTDAMLADQISQLSFQQIEGLPISDPLFTTVNYEHATMAVRYLNPSPGVQGTKINRLKGDRLSAINQAGFKMFSMLSAYTGRSATYGPQDLSTMILALGEVISTVEWIRRVFGCMFLWSERNRNYPLRVITMMGVNAQDLVNNYSNYRTRFNSIVQRINQIPIPKSIAYFDKCASLYEKIYMDSESPMATLIWDNPATTWVLDESTNPNGTMLRTVAFCMAFDSTSHVYQTMGGYISKLETMVGALLNSSTLNVVYTDILNLATKMKVEFWKFDYLSEAYSVQPEYNENYLLQLHNTVTIAEIPITYTDRTQFDATFGVTPYNDVLPDATNNLLQYNPMFTRDVYRYALADSIKPVPDVVDRIEMLRYTSGGGYYTTLSGGAAGYCDFALPDHYCIEFRAFDPTAVNPTTPSYSLFSAALTISELRNSEIFTTIDWAPFSRRFDENTDSQGVKFLEPKGELVGDTNYYTWVSNEYLSRIIDFVGIALYSIR